jgi:transposase-like protein
MTVKCPICGSNQIIKIVVEDFYRCKSCGYKYDNNIKINEDEVIW